MMSGAACGANMGRRLVYSPDALRDMEAARDWYDNHREGLGDEFLGALKARIELVLQFPGAFSRARKGYRVASLDSFPYAVVYRYDDDEFRIAGVIHTSRGPNVWRDRLG
jgi:plasmid stabilization system protein ParE